MPSARISNTTPYTTYKMWVTAKNAIGEGETAGPVSAQFNGCTWATFDEDASQNVTWQGLLNPDGDGVNYRLAKVTHTDSDAVIAFATEGIVEVLMVSGGQGGRGSNHQYSGGQGGSGGGIYNGPLHVEATGYNVVAGTGGSGGRAGGSNPGGPGDVYVYGEPGKASYIGDVLIVRCSKALNEARPIMGSLFTGLSDDYGVTGETSTTNTRPGGGGGGGGDANASRPGKAGTAGIVLMRVPI